MAVLDVSHPNIAKFIDAKRAGGLEHFNPSLAVPVRFMRAVLNGSADRLVNPCTGRAVARGRRQSFRPDLRGCLAGR
jgi:ribonucleoside-diphosphate reductase alpha chain